jgi:hypothetical protein
LGLTKNKFLVHIKDGLLNNKTTKRGGFGNRDRVTQTKLDRGDGNIFNRLTGVRLDSANKSISSSSGIVSKSSLLLLAVIVSIIVFRLGINVLAWIYAPSSEPYIIKGMLSGQSSMTIPQDESGECRYCAQIMKNRARNLPGLFG